MFYEAAGTEAEAAERPYEEGSRARGAPGVELDAPSEAVGMEGGAGVEGISESLLTEKSSHVGTPVRDK